MANFHHALGFFFTDILGLVARYLIWEKIKMDKREEGRNGLLGPVAGLNLPFRSGVKLEG